MGKVARRAIMVVSVNCMITAWCYHRFDGLISWLGKW